MNKFTNKRIKSDMMVISYQEMVLERDIACVF